jgi:hypothetical protein
MVWETSTCPKSSSPNPECLAREATAYAIAFNKEEDSNQFWIGCSDFTTNRAFVRTIEAARQLASGINGQEVALKLLAMAMKEVQREPGTKER